jgi:hypothetical protein
MNIIRTYENYIQAHMALGQLDEHGIKGYLQDEFSVTIDPLLTNAIGGIKLIVAEQDTAEAITILTMFETNAAQ